MGDESHFYIRCFCLNFGIPMRALFSILFSVIIFAASFQNSLFMIDYQINQDFYEIHCVNKAKPDLECHGKCQLKKESEKSTNPFNQVKYSFEFNILPAKPFAFTIKNSSLLTINRLSFNTENSFIKEGFYEILPHPPQFI